LQAYGRANAAGTVKKKAGMMDIIPAFFFNYSV